MNWRFCCVLPAAMLSSGAALPRHEVNPHYLIVLHMDPAHERLRSRVRIDLPARDARDGKAFLLSKNYTVLDLKSSRNATASIADTDKPFPGLQRIELKSRGAARGRVWAIVEYSGKLLQTEQPPVNAITRQRLELSADSLWYPISDDFNTRFTYDARITGLPRAMRVVAPERVRIGPGAIELHRTRPSQDIAFSGAIGIKSITRGDLTIAAKDFSHGCAQVYLRNAPKALSFIEHWLGPIPTRRATISIVQRANGTGYSRPGYLVVADNGAPFAADDVWGSLGYVAHELSHGWWSNADFMGEDYWLVESPAEYTALRFIEAQRGPGALTALIAGKQARAAKAGPILGHGRPSDDAVYAKGPLLLISLERQIGRPTLDRLLANLAKRPTLTTADFLAELKRLAGSGAADQFQRELRS